MPPGVTTRGARQPVRQARGFLILICILVCLAASSKRAAADGWKIQLQGAKLLGSSYAGRSVMTEDASSIWFNPAGMTELGRGFTLTAGAPLITYQLNFRDAGSLSLLGQPTGGETMADGGDTALVPHVYLAKGLNDRWHFGFGFNAPYGLGTNYGETWSGRYHATETRLTVFNLNPTIAVRLHPRVSAAFGLDVQRSVATVANMIDFGSVGAVFGLPLAPQQHDGSVSFKGFDWAAGWNAGVFYRVTDDWRLGASFRSRIDHNLSGDADFTVPSEAAVLTQGGRVFADTRAELTLPMPSELSISASRRLTDTSTILGDFTWTDWSAFERLRIEFDNPSQLPVEQDASWEDSVRVAVGLRKQLNTRWTATAGAAYETTPVPDATRTPRLPERDHTWVSGAVTYATQGRWTFDIHASHLITPDAPISLTDPTAGEVVGSVHWRLTVIGFGAVVRF